MVRYRPHTAYRRPNRPYSPALGQTFDEMLGFTPALGDVLRFVYHSGGAWLGVYVGQKEKSGLLSNIGWVIGIGMGVAAILDVVSLGKRICGTHPPEKIAPPTEPTGITGAMGVVRPGGGVAPITLALNSIDIPEHELRDVLKKIVPNGYAGSSPQVIKTLDGEFLVYLDDTYEFVPLGGQSHNRIPIPA